MQLGSIHTNYLFLPNDRVKWKAAIGVTLVVFLILFLLQPFNAVVHGFTFIGIVRITSYALAAGIAILVSELYLIKYYQALFNAPAFYHPLLWYLFEVFFSTTLIFVCKNAWLNFDYFNWTEYLIVLQRGASIAIFPLMILGIFLLTRKTNNSQILLRSEHQNEYLSTSLESLLFLQSEDNYTSIYYLHGNKIKKRILRGSLSSFEQQLAFPVVRCHRSFIVNMSAIRELKGNSQGYVIGLNHSDQTIKVSRKYISSFRTSWEQYCTQAKPA